eukprot:Plantae.Rhodophyta-Hildenbrandia_rubra.ctg6872.p1 GENE.Plantae.Rhodophyta-Hildenbrandia_rubra.ctg6872~~Plantae.Rhodophyta-Hildenbrandia_rubra.ctg6872.p1  ORF type:complete len:122 (-),score=5.13 Plantae.Rhodophyta-Hildenbrandia_rubra.ctg6872:178-543(-)
MLIGHCSFPNLLAGSWFLPRYALILRLARLLQTLSVRELPPAGKSRDSDSISSTPPGRCVFFDLKLPLVFLAAVELQAVWRIGSAGAYLRGIRALLGEQGSWARAPQRASSRESVTGARSS